MDTFFYTENSSDVIENITKRGVGWGWEFGAWSLLSASNLVPRAFPLKKEKPWGRGCSASTLNPPMQRNITRKPRSEEQRTTLNAIQTDI